MKVLFVCRANVGRSQMAMEFFNRFSKKNHAFSAGTVVGDTEGKNLDEKVMNGMAELGYDLSKNTRKQLTLQMVEEADKIFVMAQKETIPDYLKNSKKTVYWNVPDGKGQPYYFVCKMRDQIKDLVEELVKEIG